MKELEKEIQGKGSVKGFKFTQIFKGRYSFIYKVDDGIECWYEVFERRISKENTQNINGIEVHFEEKEVYPTENAFGIWAWTKNTLERALEKANGISLVVKKRIEIKNNNI